MAGLIEKMALQVMAISFVRCINCLAQLVAGVQYKVGLGSVASDWASVSGCHTVQVITEHALLPVIPGKEGEFELAFAEARAIIASMPGCQGVSLSRSIESPSTYLLLVDWERVEDHTIGFRQSEQYQQWRALLHHFYEPFPVVEHYRSVLANSTKRA